METLTCIKQRRSIRRFLPQPPDKSVIREIIDYTRFAPSWANTRVPRFTYLSNPLEITRLGTCCTEHNKAILAQAPGLFLVSAVTGRSGLERDGTCPYPSHSAKEWLMFDCGIAVQTLCLAAWDLGIGTVILGGYDIVRLASLLPLPPQETLVAVIAVGYPDESPQPPKRSEIEKILRFL